MNYILIICKFVVERLVQTPSKLSQEQTKGLKLAAMNLKEIDFMWND